MDGKIGPFCFLHSCPWPPFDSPVLRTQTTPRPARALALPQGVTAPTMPSGGDSGVLGATVAGQVETRRLLARATAGAGVETGGGSVTACQLKIQHRAQSEQRRHLPKDQKQGAPRGRGRSVKTQNDRKRLQ